MAPDARRAGRRAPTATSLLLVIVIIVAAAPTLLTKAVAQTTTSSVAQEALEDCPTEAAACQEDTDCFQCSSGVVPATQAQFDSCIASVYTEDMCTAYGIILCCMDALSPEISCLENAAFLGYNTCVIEGSTGVSCPGWSCAEIGVTLPDAGNSTDLGGGTSGELTGITEDSGSEVYDTDTTSVECPLETDACQSDPVCVECSGVVTEENDQEWESCINSVSTQDLCVGYGVVLCCMTELSANNCMVNTPFIDYYQCVIRTSTGQACAGWNCDEIGVYIGAIEEEDHDAGSGELTGITSLSTSPAPIADTIEAAADASAAAAGYRRRSPRFRAVGAVAGVAWAGCLAAAALG